MDIGHEKRHNARTPCNEEISFTLPVDNGEIAIGQARILDISATGMGIISNLQLNKDQAIYFTPNQPGWELPPKGVVIWSYKEVKGCRAGLEFILSEAK